MAPRTGGRPPLTTEPRRVVGMLLPARTIRQTEALATQRGTSKTQTLTWLVLVGADMVARGLGWDPIDLPPYLRKAIDPEQKPLFSPLQGNVEAASSSIKRESASQVQARIPVSLFARLEEMAERLGVSTTSLCSWALVQELNVLLLATGQPKASIGPQVEKLLQASLQRMAEQDTLLSAEADEKEERLAS